MSYIQCGRNSKYPNEIVTWRIGEIVPEWLSDISKVVMDRYGEILLDTRKLASGGYEIVESGNGNSKAIVKVEHEEDYVCYGEEDKKIFSLTPVQLSLLYVEKKEK